MNKTAINRAIWMTSRVNYLVCIYCHNDPRPNSITGMPHCCDEAQVVYDKWAEKQDWITECLQAGCVSLTVVDSMCTECGAKEE